MDLGVDYVVEVLDGTYGVCPHLFKEEVFLFWWHGNSDFGRDCCGSSTVAVIFKVPVEMKVFVIHYHFEVVHHFLVNSSGSAGSMILILLVR